MTFSLGPPFDEGPDEDLDDTCAIVALVDVLVAARAALETPEEGT